MPSQATAADGDEYARRTKENKEKEATAEN